MQTKPQFVTANELHKLARRFQRLATALTRLACAANDYPILLKVGTLAGVHLSRIESSASRVCSSAARQVMPNNDEVGRSLLI